MLRRALTLVLFLAVALYSQQDGKRADIRKLMEITGTRALMEQFSRQLYSELLDDIKEKYEGANKVVPEKFWDEAFKLVMGEVAAQLDQLLDRMVPIYDKYLTHAEIKELIRFYETPVGKKILSALPQIMQESGAVGAEWGKEIGPALMEKVSKRLAEMQQQQREQKKK